MPMSSERRERRRRRREAWVCAVIMAACAVALASVLL